MTRLENETLDQKIQRVTAEELEIVPYNPAWPSFFEEEKNHLLTDLPQGLIRQIEHFGSTAVCGLCAKPIVDIAIIISDVQLGRRIIPEILEPQGYDCFWRPVSDKDEPPYFTWCIGRHPDGGRKYHLHFVGERGKDDELRFRDILRSHPQTAREYGELKMRLCKEYHNNRVEYTKAKGNFIRQALQNY